MIIKSLRQMLAAIAMLFATQSALAQNVHEGRLQLGSLRANPGEEVWLEVLMESEQENVVALQFDLTLPEGFSYVLNSKGNVTTSINNDRTYDYDDDDRHTVSGKVQANDPQTSRVLLFSFANAEILKQTGWLLKIKVKADESIVAGNHTAALSGIIINRAEAGGEKVRYEWDDAATTLRTLGVETVSLRIPEGGFSTLVLPFASNVPSNLHAYSVANIDDDKVVLQEQEHLSAGVPYIIGGNQGEYSFTGNNSSATDDVYSNSVLTGYIIPAMRSNGYVLQQQTSGFGFYRLAKERQIPAYRCVLEGAVSQARFLSMSQDDVTVVSLPSAINGKETVIYDLSGRRLNRAEKGRVVISDGKARIY